MYIAISAGGKKDRILIASRGKSVLLSPLFIKSCIHGDPAPHSPQPERTWRRRAQMASPK